ncbi:hypothetical protein H0H81_002845 [Sphagnurus paluster]|uniref:AB hydrolase-1 domain-containing protein n=1 Tax=Sphagnurus paluster TaxID=117069 RepID=A0A9P7FZC3_9AGAR|nr:hypothetical protein H0H81_002845 [Sphagnurus paluster]
MASTLSTKLHIPHTKEPNCSIVGVLEQISPSSDSKGRKLALILHGTMGHKDYLYQKRLASKLPLDSFRFDFRGNHESGGTWREGALEEDLVDLLVVVDYLKVTYGYVIDLVVGHSRGSLVGLRWVCTTEEGRNISGLVNVSGRYRMSVGNLQKALDTIDGKIWKASFDEYGYYEWNVRVAKKQVTVKLFPEDFDELVYNWDTSLVWDQFPQTLHVLTVHGLADMTVPPYDALIYTRALSNRTPGTHVLNFMEDTDHIFTGRKDKVVETILVWWATKERGDLKTGVWVEPEHNSPKPKL